MKSPLLFEFTVDKATATIHIKREFKASKALVWEAWTNPQLLDKWWAPKPYHIETKQLDLQVGGRWLYAMVSPKGDKIWCKADYLDIEKESLLSWLDAFCDEAGVDNQEKPRSLWTSKFSASAALTTVTISLKHEKLEDVEAMIEMGFKEGLSMSLENLDSYLASRLQLLKENKKDNQPRVSSYLNFDGKTKEAFLFYQSVFKTEFIGKGIQYFGDIPPEAGQPEVAEEIKQMVLHVELPISGGHTLMGTDAPKQMGFELSSGNNVHICIQPESREEADRLFKALSAGGNVTMPLADMFFGAYFGEFTDKYGINWMINFSNQ